MVKKGSLSHLSDDHLKQETLLIQRQLLIEKAKVSMPDFCQIMMPDPEDPDDVTKTEYQRAGHSNMLCDIVQNIQSRKTKRVAVAIPPQHGKTIHLTQLGLAWLWGKNPKERIIVATYNQTRADELGHEFRQMIKDRPVYQQVFPEVEFVKEAKSKSFMQNTAGGKIFFIGVGGSITGRTADKIIIDDPYKGDDDEFTDAHLEKIWSWFFKVAYSRASNRTGICVIHCMTGDTPVLMGNGKEKLLKDIRTDDMVASYKDGNIVSSKVLNWKNQGSDKLFTIKMKSGINVRANARHPFLVYNNGEELWQRTDSIKKGTLIRRVIGENGKIKNAQSKNVINQQDVKDYANLTIAKKDGQKDIDHHHVIHKKEEKHIYDTDMESRLNNIKNYLMNKKGCVQFVKNFLRRIIIKLSGMVNSLLIIVIKQEKSEDCYVTNVTLQSDMGEQEIFYGQQLNTLTVINDEVVDVIEEGYDDVFDIQVENTENFIANGLVSHNTRWHEDDLIGRLCDPSHPERKKRFSGIADDWEHMNIPGVIKSKNLAHALGLDLEKQTDSKVISQFGNEPMTALWPKEKSLEFFAQWKKGDPRSFSALVMGSPAPDEGVYFTEDMIMEYGPADIPNNLRKYGASDHAVSEKQQRDFTVLGCVGVDDEDNIWVLPDLVMDRMETDRTVEEILGQMNIHQPMMWWMESELISKSFGPFLRKRMVETKTFTMIDPVVPTKDKRSRARSIQGRMSMRKVFFPRFAPWWVDAKNQLLKFPYGANDDFVDFMAHIGLGLTKELAASPDRVNKSNLPKVGTGAWVIHASKKQARSEQIKKRTYGW